MDTKIIRLSNLSKDETDAVFLEASNIIKNGGLVAFPTETVYGLGANALNEDAAAKIYSAKGRPSDNPLIAHIASMDQVYDIACDISEKAEIIMKAFWPGPLTIIFNKKDIVPYGTTGGLNTVAVRMPDNKVARRLIKESGVPIAAPSANISGKPSPTTADTTAKDMAGRIDMIIDGGNCRIGIESTIIDMTEEIPVILRPGFITRENLSALIGEVIDDKALDVEEGENFRPKAPGQKYRHYAPAAEMTLVCGKDCNKVSDKIKDLVEISELNGKKVGIIATDESLHEYKRGIVRSIGSRNNLESVAFNLYEILRGFDDTGVDIIYSEAFDFDKLGCAVMNRMVKAAGHRIIKV